LRWQTISTRTLLGYLKKKNSNGNLSVQINIKGQTRNKKSHVNASLASLAPSTTDSVSLREDSEPLIYQDRPISQKVAKERLKRKQEKDKVGEVTVINLLQQFRDTLVEIEDKKNKTENLC
jgi:hypothetical protein